LAPLSPSPPPSSCSFSLLPRPAPNSTLFPYTTLFRSHAVRRRRPALLRRLLQRLGTGLLRRRVRGLRRHGPALLHRRAVRLGLRSEEHTSELQSLRHLVCRLLLEKKKEDGSNIRHRRQ